MIPSENPRLTSFILPYKARLPMKFLDFLYFLMVHFNEEKKSQFLQKIEFFDWI